VIENLNLASQPFRNRTLPWTIAVVVALVSVVALVFTLSQWRETRARSLVVERDVQGLHAESDQLRQQAGEINGQFTDEQRRTLDAAHLIVDRRNFSWSRLLADLETTLPQGVRVSRITVRDINGSGGRARAELELAVLARNAADVTNMIGGMAGSGIFSADLLTQSQAPKGEAGIEATMRVRYTPPAVRSAGPNSDDKAAERRDAQPAARTDVTRATAHAEAAR
jgi:Tfp pilus assembly protein PilN